MERARQSPRIKETQWRITSARSEPQKEVHHNNQSGPVRRFDFMGSTAVAAVSRSWRHQCFSSAGVIWVVQMRLDMLIAQEKLKLFDVRQRRTLSANRARIRTLRSPIAQTCARFFNLILFFMSITVINAFYMTTSSNILEHTKFDFIITQIRSPHPVRGRGNYS